MDFKSKIIELPLFAIIGFSYYTINITHKSYFLSDLIYAIFGINWINAIIMAFITILLANSLQKRRIKILLIMSCVSLIACIYHLLN